MATCHAPVASLGRGVAIRHWAAVAAGLGLGAAEMDEKHQNRCEEVRSKTLHNYFQRDAGSRAPLKTKMKPDEASPKKLLCKIIIQLEVPLLVKRATSRMW